MNKEGRGNISMHVKYYIKEKKQSQLVKTVQVVVRIWWLPVTVGRLPPLLQCQNRKKGQMDLIPKWMLKFVLKRHFKYKVTVLFLNEKSNGT